MTAAQQQRPGRVGAVPVQRQPAKPVIRRPSLRFEKELFRGGPTRLAAMDEVGRGALAGPVSIGVVVITPSIGRVPPGLADSKLLTPAAREQLVRPIRRWVTEFAALRTAGRRALAALSGPVDAVLLDGNHNYLTTPSVLAAASDDLPLFELEVESTAPTEPPVHVKIKADMTCAAVAGASVLAKTERDRLLVEMDPRFPRYGFAENKGYGTPEHVAALREYGPSTVHRRSWRLPGEEPDLFCESTDLLVGPEGMMSQ